MPFLADVQQRRRQPEVMDQPGLDEPRHFQALRGLERINSFSGSARILWPSVKELAGETGRPLRLLDVASGAGDVPIRLWQKARRAGFDLHVEGRDVSPAAVAYAGRRAAERGAAIQFFVGDALAGELPTDYDIVTCSLFLHHLDEEEAIGLLRRMANAASRLVLVNDLVRSRLGFVLAYAGTRLLTRSPVVHVDGPRSVEGAFTVEEIRALAERAGLPGATVERRWPCRFLLRWRRP